MNKLDFLSEAPKTLIFQHNSNKSNFGGVLTLIYIIIVLFIAFSFIYDYETGLKYSVIYTYDEEYLDDESEKRKLQDERYNPEITYKFGIRSNVSTSNFFIYLKNQNETINFGEERKSKVYSFNAYIGYKCSKLGENDYNCSLKSDKLPNSIVYFFSLNYTGTKIVHENQELPLQKQYISDIYYFSFDDKSNIFIKNGKQ
mgnify:CR=1 FL=1